MRWRKVRPGTTTLQANCKVPIRDWRSTRRADQRALKESRSLLIRASLSSGNLAAMRVLSSTIPINSKTWEGPSVLAATIGTQRDVNTFRRVLKFSKHASLEDSAIKKSSRMCKT